jgi:hypothetical protein
MENEKVKELIEQIKNLDGNEYEAFLKGLEVVDEAREDEEIKPETDENEGKEDDDMTENEKQIAKAEEDIEEKGKDTQTEKDRIDDSVAAQERADGDEDSQSAKDRVKESEAMEKLDKQKAEDDKNHRDYDARFNKIEDMLTKLVETLMPKQAGENATIEEKKEKYGLGAKPVVTQGAEEFDEKKINQLLGR